MDPNSSLNPFTGVRGTKPWILDRIVNPPSRHYAQAKAPPLIPHFMSRWGIVRLSVLLLATCMLLFWWQSNPFGVGLATGDASATCATTSTSASQPSAKAQASTKPAPLRSMPTLTASGRPSTPAAPQAKPAATSVPNGTRYEVKSGDSLWVIASKYKVTVDDLKAANGLTSTLLHVGDQLTIPAKSQ